MVARGGRAARVSWDCRFAVNATDNLAVGQTATEKFTVTVSDGHGGTASQLVTITINATNEAPTISADTEYAETENATTPKHPTPAATTVAEGDNSGTHPGSA